MRLRGNRRGQSELPESVSSRFSTWARAQDELVLLTACNAGVYGAIREGFEFALRCTNTLSKAESARAAFGSLIRRIGVKSWMGWLDAGDYVDPSAFTISDAVGEQTDSSWVCGLHAYTTHDGDIFDARLPFRLKRRDLEAGIDGTLLPGFEQE